jgi:hypothetical protein
MHLILLTGGHFTMSASAFLNALSFGPCRNFLPLVAFGIEEGIQSTRMALGSRAWHSRLAGVVCDWLQHLAWRPGVFPAALGGDLHRRGGPGIAQCAGQRRANDFATGIAAAVLLASAGPENGFWT